MIFDYTAFVEGLYPALLGRPGSDADVTAWVNALNTTWTPAQVISAFEGTQEYQNYQYHPSFNGGATDVSSFSVTRNANYTGGTAGYVNGALRITDTVGAGATAFEWASTAVLNNYANAGQNVAAYAQGNGFGAGPTWAAVSEAFAHGAGTVVAHEIDIGRASPGAPAVGIDIVNTGNATAAIRIPEGVPAIVDTNHPDTYIKFTAGGGLQIVVHGAVVQSWT